ncbi:MAG: branched-chain amino acid ABC transporter permease [Candidatus Velthaea sp.]
MRPELVAQLIIDGLFLGGVFALSALGLNVIFGVTRIVNLAHGEFVVFAALFAAVAFQRFGITPLEVLPLTMLGGFIAGALLERLVMRRLPEDAPSAEVTSLLLTFGVSYFLIGLGLAIFTGDFRSVAYLTGSFQIGPLSFGIARLIAFVCAAVIAAILALLLRYTRLGRALRAASQNVQGAKACGIDIARMRTLSFAVGIAIAAAAGTLLSMIYAVNPDGGSNFTLVAFSVVALGGLGSYTGTWLASAILGIAVTFVGFYANTQIAGMAPYVIFILVLLVRPNGLLGKGAA